MSDFCIPNKIPRTSLLQVDLVEKGIKSGMNWGLLPTAAVFCSVLPGEYVEGM